MSETKRRSKKTEAEAPERTGAPRQTRVTLAKDVSSKYRKILPRAGSAPAGDGGAPPKRRGPAAPRAFRRSEDSDSGRPARPPRGPAGADRPPRSPRGPAGADRPPRSPRGPAGLDRPFRAPRGPAGPGRAPAARPMRDSVDPTAFRAIVHRELPEAAKQLRETREVLLVAAEAILGLVEDLSAVHKNLESKLSESDRAALAADLEAARTAITHIFEKMSFQDLAGQRLMKVDSFFKSLDEALKKPPRSFSAERKSAPRRDGFDRKPRAPRGEKPEKAERKSRLKGPQAAGEGLGQNDIDSILADL